MSDREKQILKFMNTLGMTVYHDVENRKVDDDNSYLHVTSKVVKNGEDVVTFYSYWKVLPGFLKLGNFGATKELKNTIFSYLGEPKTIINFFVNLHKKLVEKTR